MTAVAANTDDVRVEAARLAAALIRFAQVAAHRLKASTPPGSLQVGTDAYVFMPSSRRVRGTKSRWSSSACRPRRCWRPRRFAG